MSTLQLEIEEELADLLRQLDQPVQKTARELIVLGLYSQGTVSSGKAAQLLGIPRTEFIQRAGSLGLPFFDMTQDEWEVERMRSQEL